MGKKEILLDTNKTYFLIELPPKCTLENETVLVPIGHFSLTGCNS